MSWCIGGITLTALHISYQDYFAGGQFIHFLLGPATVGLALPLYKQVAKLKRLWLPISLTLIVGVSLASASTVLIANYLGASHETLLSLAPKSVTTPVAMSISEQIGGVPSLTAVFVIITGIIGAIFGSSLWGLPHTILTPPAPFKSVQKKAHFPV